MSADNTFKNSLDMEHLASSEFELFDTLMVTMKEFFIKVKF